MRRRHLRLLVVASVFALCTSAAHGQSSKNDASRAQSAGAGQDPVPAPPAAIIEAGDIIVTAQKRSERLKDVPMSISAASGEQLARAGVTDPSQLVKLVPGFTYQLSQYGTPVFGIRGVSFFDTSGTAAPAVSVYVDQIPLPLSIITRGAALDVERVEVLKGPQGTLFGQNATAGAVNYIAAKPTYTLAAGGDITFGRFGQLEAGGYLGDAITDTLSFRISGRTEQRDDWQYSTSRDDQNGKRDFTVARALIDWKPTSALRLELNVNGWRDRSDTQAAQFVSYAPTLPPPNGYAPAISALTAYNQRPTTARAANWDAGFSLRRDDSFFQTALRADWDVFADATVTSLSSYSHFDGKAPADPDGTDYIDVRNTLRDDLNVFSQELRLAFSTGPFRWLVGGNYDHQRLDETGENLLNGTNTQFFGIQADQQRSINNQKVDTYAAFGGLEWKITSTFGVQGSLRYTRQDRSYQGCSADGGNGRFALAFGGIATLISGIPTVLTPGGCISLVTATGLPSGLISRSLDDDNLAWHGGINWKPNNDLLLYVSATKGYKAGGFSTLPIGFTSQVTSVQQESVLAYEAGVKATLLQGRLQVDAAAFSYDYRNKQIAGSVPVPPFGTLPAVVNVPKSLVQGAEMTLSAQLSSALKLNASASYIDSRVTRHFFTSNPFGQPIDIYGYRLPTAPRWQATLDAEYDIDTAGRWQPYAGAALNYQSDNDAIFDDGDQFSLPGRTLIDIRAGVQTKDGEWSVQAFGRNVTNRYYWINVAHTVDTVAKYAGMPATYGVSLRHRFQ